MHYGLFDGQACGGAGVLDGESPSGDIFPVYPFRDELEQNPRPAGVLLFGDYQIRDGRLLLREARRFRTGGAVDLGPALYVWPGDGGVWLESSRGSFGIADVSTAGRDACASARATVLRMYRPDPGASEAVIDYVWTACIRRTAVTPFGLFEAETPEAFEALELCAVRRGCSHD